MEKQANVKHTELKTYEKYKKRAEIARGGKIELPPHLQEDDPENYKDYKEILQALQGDGVEMSRREVNNITKHTQHQLVESTPVSRGISKHRDHQSHYSTIKKPSNPSEDKLRRNHKEGDESPECINDNKNQEKRRIKELEDTVKQLASEVARRKRNSAKKTSADYSNAESGTKELSSPKFQQTNHTI